MWPLRAVENVQTRLSRSRATELLRPTEVGNSEMKVTGDVDKCSVLVRAEE